MFAGAVGDETLTKIAFPPTGPPVLLPANIRKLRASNNALFGLTNEGVLLRHKNDAWHEENRRVVDVQCNKTGCVLFYADGVGVTIDGQPPPLAPPVPRQEVVSTSLEAFGLDDAGTLRAVQRDVVVDTHVTSMVVDAHDDMWYTKDNCVIRERDSASRCAPTDVRLAACATTSDASVFRCVTSNKAGVFDMEATGATAVPVVYDAVYVL